MQLVARLHPKPTRPLTVISKAPAELRIMDKEWMSDRQEESERKKQSVKMNPVLDIGLRPKFLALALKPES